MPVVIDDAACLQVFLAGRAGKIKNLLPPGLVPVIAVPGMAVICVTIFKNRKTSIGPYREAIVSFAARRRALPTGPISLLLEGRTPGAGFWVHESVVDAEPVAEMGHLWGIPRKTGEIEAELGESAVSFDVKASGRRVFSLRANIHGRARPFHAPMIAFTRHAGGLMRTAIPIEGLAATKRSGIEIELETGAHPLGKQLKQWVDEPVRPLMLRWMAHMVARFPAGVQVS